MRHLKWIAVLIPVVMFQSAISGQSEIQLEGVVLEAVTERPIGGVLVTAVAGEIKKEAMTDPQGRFSIDLPGAERYRLTPAREGMVDARPNRLQTPHEAGIWVQVSGGTKIPAVTLYMQPAGVISGQALDADGKAYPGTRGSVSPMRYTYDDNGKKILRLVPGLRYGNSPNGRMDEKGNYRLYGLQPGDYYISASGGSNASMFYPNTPDEASATLIHVDAGQEVNLPLITLPAAKTIPVHFHVTDSDGKPIANSGDLRALEFHFPQGRVLLSGDSLSLFAPPNPIPLPFDRTISFPPGQYDFLVGLVNGSNVYYTSLQLNVSIESDQDLHLSPGLRVTGNIKVQDDQGRSKEAPGLYCKLSTDARYVQSPSASSALKGCLGSSFSPGLYRLDLGGMPADAYVASAESGGKDILADGLSLTADADLQIVVKTGGAGLNGSVKNSAGERITNAIVALVPDAPLRGAGVFYRSVVSDVNGSYQLRGIAPGSYHLFAWSELEGAAYRNAEFMKDFNDRGLPVQIQGANASLDVTVLN